MIDLTPLFEALIVLLGAIITKVVVPWVASKTDEIQQRKIRDWVNIAVYAAEKMYGHGHGSEKLDYARHILAEHNIELDTGTLTALIDAEIRRMEIFDDPELLIED